MPDPVQRAREFVASAFAELNVRSDINETALIRDGVYCGQRFVAGGLSAVWFFEENQVKIYDDQQGLVRVERLEQDVEPTPLRRAA